MINIASAEFNIDKYIDTLSKGDPFGCRIKSLYDTYNYNLPFVDFWIQSVEGVCVSLIARLETTFILQLTNNSDLDEVSSFLRVSGALSIICNGKYKLECGLDLITGPILVNNSSIDIDNEFTVVEPTVKEVYDVISHCNSDNFSVPYYESFVLDVSHKLNKHSIRIYGIKDNALISCIMTLAESEDCAVLGALATVPKARNNGYGAYLVNYINNKLISEGKSVFLHRAKNENVEFYNKLGFKKYGIWAEYSIRD